MNIHSESACEAVDAEVFSGEILFTDLNGFKVYLDRWNRAVEEQEQSNQ